MRPHRYQRRRIGGRGRFRQAGGRRRRRAGAVAHRHAAGPALGLPGSVRVKIRVLFFARLREQVGSAGEELELEAGATLETLRARLAARGDLWSAALKPGRALRAAVNQDMAGPETPLKSGDEVAF